LSHDEIKDRLPGYRGKASMPEDVSEHLDTCPECSEEFSLLASMRNDHPPEPDGMFFETLPQRVSALVQEKKKKKFFGVIPRFALVAMLVAALTAGYIYNIMKMPGADELYAFSDPFSDGDYDLGALTPDDVPSIAGDPDLEEAGVYPDEDSFLRDLASLSPGEIDRLYEKLRIKGGNGGVL